MERDRASCVRVQSIVAATDRVPRSTRACTRAPADTLTLFNVVTRDYYDSYHTSACAREVLTTQAHPLKVEHALLRGAEVKRSASKLNLALRSSRSVSASSSSGGAVGLPSSSLKFEKELPKF